MLTLAREHHANSQPVEIKHFTEPNSLVSNIYKYSDPPVDGLGLEVPSTLSAVAGDFSSGCSDVSRSNFRSLAATAVRIDSSSMSEIVNGRVVALIHI